MVEDVGPPSDDIDSLFNGGLEEEEEVGGLVPARSLKRPYSSANKRKVPTQSTVSCVDIQLIHATNICTKTLSRIVEMFSIYSVH